MAYVLVCFLLEPTTCSGLIWSGLRTFLIRYWITNKKFQMAWIALLPLLKSELLTEPFEWNANGLEGSPISFRDSGHGEWDVSVSCLVIIPMLSWDIPASLSMFTRSLENPGFGFITWRCWQEVSASKECLFLEVKWNSQGAKSCKWLGNKEESNRLVLALVKDRLMVLWLPQVPPVVVAPWLWPLQIL